MRPLCLLTLAAGLLSTAAAAETIGVSMARDDAVRAAIRAGIQDRIAGLDGVALQIENAQDDLARQLDQVQDFVASGVDAVIIDLVDPETSLAIGDFAEQAGIPLVYLGRQPMDLQRLPDSQAFVGSDEERAGRIEMLEMCRQLGGRGKAVVITGGAFSPTARLDGIQRAHATRACGGIEVLAQRPGNGQRSEGRNLVHYWLRMGLKFGAVIADDDEMALGAIQALKAAGQDMGKVVVVGIGATRDALVAMQAGDMDATVFQDPAGLGTRAVNVALKLVRGEKVQQVSRIRPELVTPANVNSFLEAD